MIHAEVMKVAGENFKDEINKGVVLVDFFADWCMPCLMMAPVMDDLAEKFRGKIKFAKVNIEDHPELAEKFNIVSIPNFVLFKKGKQEGQFIGSMTQEDFEKKLRDFI
ncbi:MAG TPA: thioredoxin [Parachlamydiales bacterium]|nr:thioredoxin [Parachlamydiales bacterium]